MFKVSKGLTSVIMMCALTVCTTRSADEDNGGRIWQRVGNLHIVQNVAERFERRRLADNTSLYLGLGVASAALYCYVKREAISDVAKETMNVLAPLPIAMGDLYSTCGHINTAGNRILKAGVVIGVKCISGLAAVIKNATEFTSDHSEFVLGTTTGVGISYCYKKCFGERRDRNN